MPTYLVSQILFPIVSGLGIPSEKACYTSNVIPKASKQAVSQDK